MEINFRNDGNAICVSASGFNLPYLWYLSNTEGAERVEDEVCKLSLHPVYVMPEFADFDNFVRSRKISFLTWLRDVIKTDTFMVFNFKDLSPFLYLFSERIKNVCKRILHIK